MVENITVIMWAMAAVVGVTSAYCLSRAVLAIRAKIRATNLLHEYMVDAELRVYFEKISQVQQMTIEDQYKMISLLERRLSKLSQQDKSFVEEGLKQTSRAGATRYMKELMAHSLS